VITALLIFFWAVVPGLITGWMLRERGRKFLPGLLLGAVCGPLGILGVLTFIYISDRRQDGRRRAMRVFYDIPVVGRLHVSTVWMLAGVATFLCLWMVGGITYEIYRAEPSPNPAPEQAQQTADVPAQPNALLPTNTPTDKQPVEARPAEQTQGGSANQSRAALLGNFSGQPGQPAPAPPGNSATSWQPAPQPAGNATQPAPVAAATPQPNAPPAPQPPKAPAPTRADTVAEVTSDLASRGHAVHAALSGDAQSATLSLTGATLTRAAGVQLLGNGRLRGALKAAGVRIVVLMNGEQSWTYML
jgi:hypothetical protein